MAFLAGFVDVPDNGESSGAGYAKALFDLRMRDLESQTPNPIGIPMLGDTALPYSTRFPVDQAAVDRAWSNRIAQMRAIAKDCVQIAGWVDYYNAAFGAVTSGLQTVLLTVESTLSTNGWVSATIPKVVNGTSYAAGLWFLEATVWSRPVAALPTTPAPTHGAGYQVRRYQWQPSQTGGLALDEGEFSALRDPDAAGNELQLVPPGIAGPDTVTDAANWRLLTRRGLSATQAVRYRLVARIVDGMP
jgi:hypothetical protein